MRTIKFRAWEKKSLIMRIVSRLVGEDFLRPNSVEYIESLGLDTRLDPKGNICQKSQTLKEGEYDLMQFTGLHDKNGKEIWEGDVIKHSRFWQDHFQEDNSTIIFVNGCFEFTHHLVSRAHSLFTISDECEVLGNIHENPELLTP